MRDSCLRRVVGSVGILCVLAGAARPAGAEEVSGVVWIDANANALPDAGEKRLPGVAVTDGVSIVQTDKAGRYALDAKPDPLDEKGTRPVVSVCFPSGTWPTGAWFRRLAEVRDLQAVHFPLRQQAQKLPFYFVHATDTHVPRGGKDRIVALGSDLKDLGLPAAFVVVTGDLTNNSDGATPEQAEADFRLYQGATSAFCLPVFSVSGNHDVSGVRTKRGWTEGDWRYGYGLYRKYVGPLRWSFDYAGHHLVGVDFNTRTKGTWSWGVPPETVAWLKKDLALVAKDTPILVFFHMPQGDPELRKVLAERKVIGMFSGHVHGLGRYTFAGKPGFKGGSVSQIFGTGRVGFGVAEVTAGGVDYFYKELSKRIAVTLSKPGGARALGKTAGIEGAFFDTRKKVRTLVVAAGDKSSVTREIPFQRTPLCCRFAADVDLSALPEGFQPLTVRLLGEGGKELGTWSHNFLMLTGKQGAFTPAVPVELVLDVAGIDTEAAIALNGTPLAKLSPTKLKGDSLKRPLRGADRVRLPVPADRLRRLNTVTISAGTKPDGKADVLYLLDAHLACGKKTFRDIRYRHGPYSPVKIGKPVTRYIDLLAR